MAKIGIVVEAVREFLSTLFTVTAIAGVFLIWGGLSQWLNKAPFGGYFPLIVMGMALLAVGIWYHRDSWFFKPPMKPEDLKLEIGNKEEREG